MLDSHGPGERIPGSAAQIYQRYLTLAQEAARTDDRVAAENYYQHAEHYFRVNNESRVGNSAGTSDPIGRGTDHQRGRPQGGIRRPAPFVPIYRRFPMAKTLGNPRRSAGWGTRIRT